MIVMHSSGSEIAPSELAPAERERYARQIGPGILSPAGQLRLKKASALVSRTGGMGGPAALALVMAGVGRVIIAHGGRLISPDLNRQILGNEQGLGQPRAGPFADYLRSMNSHVEVEAIDHEPDDAEASALARRVDIVISCPPTFAERMRLNQAAVSAGVPLVDAAQWGISGTLVVVGPGKTACLRCLYPSDPPFDELFPVLGAISMAVGSLAALEAIKILSGCGNPLFGRLTLIDGGPGRFSQIELRRDPACPCCGTARGNSPNRQTDT
jgi:molybdopterin-synthase adenylyltransferase